MKKIKIAYNIGTGALTLLMLFSAGMYIFNNEAITEIFKTLGYPTYIIYPLATAKVLGLLAIWTNISKSLKEWAYAGFFFDLVLAFFAHYMIGEEVTGAVLGTVFLAISYGSWKKMG